MHTSLGMLMCTPGVHHCQSCQCCNSASVSLATHVCGCGAGPHVDHQLTLHMHGAGASSGRWEGEWQALPATVLKWAWNPRLLSPRLPRCAGASTDLPACMHSMLSQAQAYALQSSCPQPAVPTRLSFCFHARFIHDGYLCLWRNFRNTRIYS